MRAFDYQLPFMGTAGALVTCSAFLAPLQAAARITYDDDILPIFEAACLNCHNPDKKKGDLDLSNYTGVMAGGSGGTIANPGDGAGSKLYASITQTAEPFMPPKGDKLEKKNADLVRAWIDGGLLENKSSKAKKSSGPKIAKLDIDPSAKPEGPPPMPGNLNLEPIVISSRNTVVNDMACSPWAPLLAVTGQKQILLYNTDTLKLAAILPFPRGFPETVSFHPTGKYLMAGGGIPGKSGTTYTWDVTTGKMLMTNGREFDSVLAASLRLDLGGVALGGPSRLIKLWDTQTGEEIKSIKKHTDWVTALSYSPDGVLLATGDRNGGVWIWEAHNGNEFHTLRGHSSGITAISWRADSNIVGTASEDGQLIFWEMNSGGQVKKFTAHGGGTLSLDYARTGEFVTSGRNREVKIWKADFNLKKSLPPFSEMVVETAITQDGKRIFTADWNGVIEAWDANTFEKLGQLSGTPPRIADRIVVLQKEIASVPEATAAARVTFEAAQKAVTDAKAGLAKATADHAATSRQISDLKTEKTKLEAALAKTDIDRTALVSTREVRAKTLTEIQARATAHKEALAEAGAAVNQFEIAPLEEAEKQLAAEAQRLRKESETKPENPALRQQAEEAARKLADHQTSLAEMRSNIAGARSRLEELNLEDETIASNAEAASKALKETDKQLQALDADRKTTVDRTAAVATGLLTANKQLPPHQEALKATQDNLAAREKALPGPKAAFEKAQAHETSLRGDLKFWRAAEVNAKVLVVTEKRDTLKAAQEEETTAADSIARQLEEFRAELSKIEIRKGELIPQLDKLGKEVAALKESLTNRKPLLDQSEGEAKALQDRYQELLK
ncbi:MAG: hypothetical protein GY872_11055 [Roseibacillus sp.]|jgi:hypothetical protein|nr:hypothetical protein [Roseibacillus sp.]|tara:strand:- start:46313 stop:48847 length:2535 start_codon:yes stop_codon:yes gene_type:complete